MNFLVFLFASFISWCIVIGGCIIYAGVTKKKRQPIGEQSMSFEDRVEQYREESQAQQEDPLARIHSIEWNAKSREVIDLRFEECS